VQLEGEPVLRLHPALPAAAEAELRWLWASLSACTRTASLLVLYRGAVAFQAGLAPAGGARGAERVLGAACVLEAQASGRANYFANLALFPARAQFEAALPGRAQALVVQPLGGEGVLLAASGTQRGFSQLDQRFLALLAQKVDSTLDAGFRP